MRTAAPGTQTASMLSLPGAARCWTDGQSCPGSSNEHPVFAAQSRKSAPRYGSLVSLNQSGLAEISGNGWLMNHGRAGDAQQSADLAQGLKAPHVPDVSPGSPARWLKSSLCNASRAPSVSAFTLAARTSCMEPTSLSPSFLKLTLLMLSTALLLFAICYSLLRGQTVVSSAAQTWREEGT